MIQTSICIGRNHKILIDSAADNLGISTNELIILLLQRSRKLFGDSPALFHTVEYQKFYDEIPIILHIYIPEVEYEYAVAKRYIFKKSVSYIIRMAIDLLLPEIIIEYNSHKLQSDINYVSTNYFKSNFIIRDYSLIHRKTIYFEHWEMKWKRESTLNSKNINGITKSGNP